jgi:DNA primase
MTINGIQFNCELSDIIQELQSQLRINNIPLLQITRDSGDDIMCSCPYHKDGQERKPSAGIRKSDGLFHCFACGETHSLQEVISHCFGHYDDIIGAFGWQWLNRNFLTVQVEERKGVDIDLTRTVYKDKNGNDYVKSYVTEEELDSYRYYHEYMWQRKLNKEIVELFDIGYDKKTDCLTFPVRTVNGNCLFVARRSVKTKYFSYPKNVEKPLYGLYELMQMSTKRFKQIFPNKFVEDEVIVCESMLDALTAWVYGKPALALNGLGTELQFEQLRHLPFRKIILATDNDEAGMKARKRIRANVKNKIITEYILPKGKKDLNELTEEEFNNLEEVF